MIRKRQTIGSGLDGDSVTKGLDSLLVRPAHLHLMVPFFVLSVVGGNTKRKDRVVVADTPPQEALSHNKTTWIVLMPHMLVSLFYIIYLQSDQSWNRKLSQLQRNFKETSKKLQRNFKETSKKLQRTKS
jgi:hypothetical protein